MSKVVIVDYGMCNLDSVARAVEECGGNPEVTSDPARLKAASFVILPGVGAFADAMAHLRERDLVEPLRERVLGDRVPFLGICLGMQLMASRGIEGGDTEGLGLISGTVQRLVPDAPTTRIPHIGWNNVAGGGPLFAGISPTKDFYFVHSYHVVPDDAADVLATTPYCGGFVSAVAHDTLFGVQFHPEKSQQVGFQLLRNFLAC
jgi:imidazole glycerol-phosphate synthase subunit HisH